VYVQKGSTLRMTRLIFLYILFTENHVSSRNILILLHTIKWLDDSKQWIGKDVEGSVHGLIYGTIPAFAWRASEKPRNVSVRGLLANTQTRYFPNSSQKYYLLSQLVRNLQC
jgi:hypothetical protein